MNRSAPYRTKQRAELTAYLKSVPGVQVTVHEMVAHFAAAGRAIGTATIYRHLERMVADGVVKKYFVDGIAGACYEYVGTDDRCYHLKCERCGRLVPFHCTELEQVQEHLSARHGFAIDTPKTVFYGICNRCGRQ